MASRKKIVCNLLDPSGKNVSESDVIHHFPAMIWHSDIDARCDFFNQTWLDFTGRSLEQELGDGWTQGVHPDDLPGCMAAYLDAFEARRLFSLEYRLLHHDGSYHWIIDRGSPHYNLDGSFAGYIGSCYDITHRKTSERILLENNSELQRLVVRQSEDLNKNYQLLKTLSEQVPGGIYQFQRFPDGRFCVPYASHSMIEQFEISPAEIEYDAATLFARVVPEDLPGLIASIEESARTLLPWRHEFRGNIPSKGVCWLQGISRPQQQADGSVLWYGFVTDITDKKMVQLELEESRIQLNDAQRIARLGSWSWIVATDEVRWSDELYVITGRGRDLPLRYADQEQLYTKESWKLLDQTVQASLLSGEPYELELDLIRADGRLRSTVARGEVIRAADGVAILLRGTLQDITERKRLETELFNAKKLESIGQLTAGVAHEVRNPLNAILTVTEALFREDVVTAHPDLTPYIGHIRSQVSRLARLMNDLLDLGRPINVAQFRPLALHDFCRQTGELWQRTGLAPNRQLQLELPDNGLELQVLADPERLQQVLFNLLENAGFHTADGSITLRLAGSKPPDEGNGCMALIQVIDQGCGVPYEQLVRLFDPFYTNRKGGTGLGLALVKHFVEQMGGAVRISNNDPGPGCTAEVNIPLIQGETVR